MGAAALVISRVAGFFGHQSEGRKFNPALIDSVCELFPEDVTCR
jgi:uncharacterized membrane protein YGL010W